MNLVNKVKDKLDKKKFKKLEKKEIWLRGEIARLQDQQETLKMAETTTNCVEDKCHLMIKKKPEKYADKKRGYDRREGSSYHKKPDDIREKGIAKRVCNKNKYRIREGNEREGIERIKELMERQHKKPLEQKLAKLMPLVRYHQDIKNAIKAKRIAVQQKLNTESVNEFLSRLSELYGRDRNNTFHRKINKKIKCNKCKKRGHLRKNCKENKGKLSKEK